MKKILLIIALITTFYVSAKAEWDLYLYRPVPGRTTMRLLSVPFEGLNRYNTNVAGNNRVSKILNGAIHRRYLTPEYFVEKPILYYSDTSSYSYLASCYGEVVSTGKSVYGFGKYLIEFENYNNPNKSISFIFNTLDSKAGMDSVLNGRPYHSDWSMLYYETSNSAYVVIDNGDTSNLRYIDTVFLGQTNREINYWYAYWRADAPLEKKFYARTTPFPVNPNFIDQYNKICDITIGTTIIFDTVYNNLGNTDRNGYNTEIITPYNYYSMPPILNFTQNMMGNNYCTPGDLYEMIGYIKYGMKITAESGDTLILKKNKSLWVTSVDYNYGGDTIVLLQGSTLVRESNAFLNACLGGCIVDSGCNKIFEPFSGSIINKNSSILFTGSNNLFNNNSFLQIDSMAKLTLADNSTVTFDGEGTYLKLNQNSIVQLGNNAKIEFKNGAKLEAIGSQISSVNGSLPGRGFVFENAGEGTTITNCVFNNLSNPIYILNTTYASSNINYNISYNIFNCNDKLNYAIESKNTNVIDIGFNNILMQTGKGLGILLKYTGDLTGGESASPSYNIQIRNNQISNGVISTAVMNLTSAYPVINYRFNNFYGSATNSNVVVNHISGDIKNNSFSSNSSACVSLNLNHAIPNILSNSFTSYAKNIYNSYSYPKIGPNPENSSDGGWIWLGGKNNIQSLYDGNLYYSGGNALLDWGQNCFYKATGSNHLWGNIDEPLLLYHVRNNDFNNSNIPISNLFDIGSGYPVNTYSSGSNFGCNNSTDAGTIWLIRDLGDGITDTIYRTNNTSGYQPPADEVLYSTAINKKLIDNNFDAVSYFKSLINSYPSSSYTEACLYDLYDCYLKLDTSGNQTVKDILFTDLKNYLDSKILSGNYSDEFSDIAYQIGVMCLTVIAEYDDAMSGYEFIALYHPDAYTRLLASWEYSEIEQLLNGSGGLSSRDDNLTDEEYFVKLSKKVNKTLTGDPVKGKLKKTYEKSKTEKAERQKAEIKSNLKDEKLAKSEIQKINQKEQASKMKVVSVLRNSKSMTREEKDKQQIEDIVIGSRTEDEKQKVENMNITPERYELGQNYPNPFNPVTNIQFQIPSLKFVKLVVYDLLGREVKTLVNEIKSPGKYIVSFDASSLSSGVYFYKMTAGDFSDVRRMVLVK